MLSIVAGMMIAIGGVIYLTLSGLEGALLFSMGLLTILCLKLELFTGKAGLLTTKEITPGKLLEIWIGNFIGTLGMALMLLLTPRGIELSNKAMEIVAIRLANGFFVNLNLSANTNLFDLLPINLFFGYALIFCNLCH